MGQNISSDGLTIIFGVIATVLAVSTLIQTARLTDRRQRPMSMSPSQNVPTEINTSLTHGFVVVDEERGFGAETSTTTTPSITLEAPTNPREEVQSVQQASSSKTSHSTPLGHSSDVVVQELSLMPPRSVMIGWNSAFPSTLARAVNEQVESLATSPRRSRSTTIDSAAEIVCVDMESKKAEEMAQVTRPTVVPQRACAVDRVYCLRGFRCHCKIEA